MKKLLTILLLSSISFSTLSYADANQSKSLLPATIVGGWYPVFFESFDKNKLDQIIKSYNNGNVKNLIISFDNNNALASQINNYILDNSNLTPQMNYEPNTDTPTVQYEHSKVVLTVYSK